MVKQKVFTVWTKVDSAKDFETFAALAARLKRHGRVEISLSSVSGKAWYDIPKGGSSWHDYTSYLSTLLKVFPHPKIAPFVDAGHVRRNQQLLRSCARVMRKHRLDAAFDSHEPWYLAEGFFARYPHLRGARVDHPRRSRQEAYAMCVDQPEAQEIIEWMMRRFMKEVPELTYISIPSNDAGSGLCWGDWIYSGPNGPDHCRSRNVGERVASLMEALKRGGGKRLEASFHANLSRAECDVIVRYANDSYFYFGQGQERREISTGLFTDNPVQGIFDPAGVIETLGRTRNPQVSRIHVGFSNNYCRSHNDPEAAEKVVEVISAFFDKPAHGLLDRMHFLQDLCVKWAGRQQADALFEALMSLHEVIKYKRILDDFIFRLSSNYLGVSMRLINRPLVAIPEKLTAQEEAYFLPHVFNVRETEARTDYLDLHGGRLFPPIDTTSSSPSLPQMRQLCSALNKTADSLEGLKSDRALAVFRRMGVSLRIYSCIMRSIHNFAVMQVLRDRNKEKLCASQPLVPTKIENWTGDPDLLRINEVMRDELDNTDTFIDILSGGGLRQMALAKTPDLEDTFLLGPDFPDTLKQKRRIMRRHWLDAEHYMASPHK